MASLTARASTGSPRCCSSSSIIRTHDRPKRCQYRVNGRSGSGLAKLAQDLRRDQRAQLHAARYRDAVEPGHAAFLEVERLTVAWIAEREPRDQLGQPGLVTDDGRRVLLRCPRACLCDQRE